MVRKLISIHILSAILILICLNLFGCKAPSSTEPTPNLWSMNAALVNQKGEVLETMTLSAEVIFWEQDGRNFYKISFDYPDNFNNSASGQTPAPDSDDPFYWGTGSNIEKGISGKVRKGFYIGFDPETESFLVDFDDGQDVYLIADRNADLDIQDLWEYYQKHISIIPTEFPTFIN